MQKIQLIGRLGKDPEMRFTGKGKAFTKFSVAVSEYNDQTSWYRVTVWGDRAENCNKYLSKGSMVYVEGRLEFDPETGGPKQWTSEKDGKTYANFEVNAFDVQFLSTKDREEEPVSKRKAPWE